MRSKPRRSLGSILLPAALFFLIALLVLAGVDTARATRLPAPRGSGDDHLWPAGSMSALRAGVQPDATLAATTPAPGTELSAPIRIPAGRQSETPAATSVPKTRPALVAPLTPTPNSGARRLSAADDGARVDLSGEQPLEIELAANWATGYRWEVAAVDETVLRLAGQTHALDADPNQMGAPGRQKLSFQAVGQGQTALRLVYRRPWEAIAPQKSYSVNISTHAPFLPFRPLEKPDLPRLVAPAAEPPAEAPSALPASYNVCSTGGGCLPIEDQGQCGSCWSFASTGAIENLLNIRYSAGHDGGEQYLVSCNTDGWGCEGGDPLQALNYYLNKAPAGEPAAGLVYEADFPYVAADTACNPPHTHHEKISSWSQVDASTYIPATTAIKQAIYDHGPVMVDICVGNYFQLYTSGVFRTDESSECGSNLANHAVLLVGWDDSQNAWIMRNSWGTGWGQAGYMYIQPGVSNIGLYAGYVVDSGTPSNTPTPSPGNGPNLQPYQPSGWDYPIVPAAVTGGHSVTSLVAGQPAYIDFAIGNAGQSEAGPFSACLYLDGTEIGRWQANSLPSNYYVTVTDWSYTVGTAGNHTLKLVADCANTVVETNESDNVYERTFTWSSSSQGVNLLPYKPQGWDYPIVPANTTGGHQVTTLTAGQPTYIDFAIGNDGTQTSGTFVACLYLDGDEIGRWTGGPLWSQYYTTVIDWRYTVATPGSHELKVVADCSNMVAETNEGDNVFAHTFTWTGSGPTPSPTPQGASVRVDPSTRQVPLQSTFTVNILAQNATNVGGYQVDLAFDPTIVHVLQADAGPFLSSTGRTVIPVSTIDNAAGLATFGLSTMGSQAGATGSGVLSIIKLQALAKGTSALRLQDLLLVSPAGASLSASTVNGQVQVNGCFGDFDGNGKVDIGDLQASAGRWNCQTGAACYDAQYDVYPADQPDGKIDVSDIQRVAAAWNTQCTTTTQTLLPGSAFEPGASLTAASLKLSPLSTAISTQDEFTLTLGVENAANAGGFQTVLTFNPAVAHVVAATVGPFLSSTGRSLSPLGPGIDNTAGRVTLGAFTFGAQPAPYGAGDLAYVRFRAQAKGGSSLVLLQPNVTDVLGNPLALDTPANGSLTVGLPRRLYLPVTYKH